MALFTPLRLWKTPQGHLVVQHGPSFREGLQWGGNTKHENVVSRCSCWTAVVVVVVVVVIVTVAVVVVVARVAANREANTRLSAPLAGLRVQRTHQSLVDDAEHECVVHQDVGGILPTEADVGDGCVSGQPQGVHPSFLQLSTPLGVLLV